MFETLVFLGFYSMTEYLHLLQYILWLRSYLWYLLACGAHTQKKVPKNELWLQATI